MNMKEKIDKRLSGVSFDPGLPDSGRKVKSAGQPLRIALAACICLLVLFTAMTAALPDVNAMVAQISPSVALFLKPLRLSCEDMGVEVKVLAAMHDEYVTVVYLSMRDLLNRPTEEFLRHYDFDMIGDGAEQFNEALAYISDFPQSEKRMRLLAMKGEAFDGKKITLRINSGDSRWETTFKIQAVTQERQKDCDIILDGNRLRHISVSPIGVSIVADGDFLTDDMDLSIVMRDGSTVQCDLSPILLIKSSGDGAGSLMTYEYTFTFIPYVPLDIDSIREIQIGDVSILFD